MKKVFGRLAITILAICNLTTVVSAQPWGFYDIRNFLNAQVFNQTGDYSVNPNDLATAIDSVASQRYQDSIKFANIVGLSGLSKNWLTIAATSGSLGSSNLYDSTTLNHAGCTDTFYFKKVPAAQKNDAILCLGTSYGTVRQRRPIQATL
jgi:hypothetical protein